MVIYVAVIKIMDELLANKIAAGEVVEKCASVVKELVENSIDAGSTEIKVELEEAGIKRITVIDNGKGMDKDDAVLAFSRHATSKVSDEDDLFHINTLGFRGEALASICSVSHVELKTSPGDLGTEVIINGGKIEVVKSGDARKGTSITVTELFYNTPARLKHLKSVYTELANITDYMNKLALSHPDIRFTLKNNDSTILQTDGSNNLLKTIKSIYGLGTAKKMLYIEGENEDYEIEGYVSLPEIHRSSRNNMVTIVNGRVVRNAEINKKINDAYHSYKPDNRYPITVLKITVDPTVIDVNIHPTKMDIKFGKMDTLLELIDSLVKGAITKKVLIPEVEVPEPSEEKEEIRRPELQTLDLGRTESTYESKNEYADLPDEIITNDDFVKETEEYKIDKNEEYSKDIKDDKNKLPELYPVGLVHGTYIICQNEKGMYLIDQHAAKERCNYEKFKKAMGETTGSSIQMLFPLTVELANNEFIILKENLEFLRSLDFVIEEFGINSVIIKSHPTWLPKGYENEAIKRIIDIIVNIEKNFSVEKFNESVATMMSCKLAIKANMNITMDEMEALIDDLRKCDNPFNCPHGRPTMIYYSNYDLEKLFKRSGFDTKK